MVNLETATREVARTLAPVIKDLPVKEKMSTDPSILYRLAEINHVGLQFASLTPSKTQIIDEVLEQKLRRRQQAAKEFNELVKKARIAGVELTAIKSFLEYDYVDDDIDCVIGKGTVDDCRQILEIAGYEEVGRRIREPKKTKFAAEGDSPDIHLHKTVSWNRVEYIDAKSVCDRARMITIAGYEVPVPHPLDEAAIHILHAVFENKCITFSEVLQLILLYQRYELQWGEIKRQVADAACRSCFNIFINHLEYILRELFDLSTGYDHISTGESDISTMPTYFSLSEFSGVAFDKVLGDMKHGTASKLFNDAYAYPLDVALYYKLRRRTKRSLSNL